MKYRLSNSSTSGSRQTEARKIRQNLIQRMPSLFSSEALLHSSILETLEIYKTASDERLRVILFLRNLELAESLGLLPKNGIKFSKLKFASQSPLDVGQAIWHKTLRDLYRKIP